MKHYYINNTTKNPNGNNEVHTEDCRYLPSLTNRTYLGYFTDGIAAVAAAKAKGYSKADGCIHCCPEAHREQEACVMGKNQHVTPHPNGGWQVKGANNSRATARTNTQAEAISIGRTISHN